MVVVGPAATVAEAEKLLLSHALDVAVVDINLRGEQAYGLIDRLHAHGVPIIVASGYDAHLRGEQSCRHPRQAIQRGGSSHYRAPHYCGQQGCGSGSVTGHAAVQEVWAQTAGSSCASQKPWTACAHSISRGRSNRGTPYHLTSDVVAVASLWSVRAQPPPASIRGRPKNVQRKRTW